MDRTGADVENGHTQESIMVRQPPFRTRNTTTTTRLKYQKRELDSRMIILILLIITIGYSSKK